MTLLEVGRIDKAHGLRGEVVVTLTTDRTDAARTRARCCSAGDRLLVVAESRPHQHRWIVHFEGVTDREEAEAAGARRAAGRGARGRPTPTTSGSTS